MGKLGKLWPWVLLAVCGGAAYQAWVNTRIPHPADAQAEAIACDELHVCGGAEADWSELDASPFVRTYRIDSGSGPVTIECRWSNVLFGTVTCFSDREDIAELVDEEPGQRPHELRRGLGNKRF